MKALTPDQQKQVEALVPLARRVALSRSRGGGYADEYQSAAYEAIIRAVLTWDPRKGTLSSWAYRYIQTYITREARFGRMPLTIPMAMTDAEAWLHTHTPGVFGLPLDDRRDAIRRKFPKLTPRMVSDIARQVTQGPLAPDKTPDETNIDPQRVIHIRRVMRVWLRRMKPVARRRVEMYFFEGLTLREISDKEGVTKQGVSLTLQNELEKLCAMSTEKE